MRGCGRRGCSALLEIEWVDGGRECRLLEGLGLCRLTGTAVDAVVVSLVSSGSLSCVGRRGIVGCWDGGS